MGTSGYVKFLRSGAYGDRVMELKGDDQRWRWWLLVVNADRSTFPGLVSGGGLRPFNELDVIQAVYRSNEFKGIMEKLETWKRDKEELESVGLIKSEKVFGEEYIWNVDWHVYQDMYTPKKKRVSEAFYKSWLKMTDKNKLVFLHLMYCFRPESVVEAFQHTALEKRVAQVAKGEDVRLILDRGGVVNALAKQFKDITESVKAVLASNERKVNPDIKRAIDYFRAAFAKQFQKEYLVTWEKDGAQIGRALKTGVSFEDLTDLMDKFLKKQDEFLDKGPGRTIGVFVSQINNLVSTKGSGEGGRDYSKYDE